MSDMLPPTVQFLASPDTPGPESPGRPLVAKIPGSHPPPGTSAALETIAQSFFSHSLPPSLTYAATPLPRLSPPRGQREHDDALLRILRALAPASESSVPTLISSAPTADVPSRYRARLRPALRESVQSSPRGHATTRDRTPSVQSCSLSHACKYAGLSRSLP